MQYKVFENYIELVDGEALSQYLLSKTGNIIGRLIKGKSTDYAWAESVKTKEDLIILFEVNNFNRASKEVLSDHVENLPNRYKKWGELPMLLKLDPERVPTSKEITEAYLTTKGIAFKYINTTNKRESFSVMEMTLADFKDFYL
jgi:hypothetical protein